MRGNDAELSVLRERCMVMKNLLLDVAANEHSLENLPVPATRDDVETAIQARAETRKALLGEIDNVLAHLTSQARNRARLV